IHGESAECIGVGRADGLLDGCVGDVFVVASGVDLCGGGEDRFGQGVGFAQTCGELDAADGARLLIILPSGAGKVAADDALYRKHLRALNEHAAAVELAAIGFEFVGKLRRVCRDEVVWNSGLKKIEPKKRELG